MTFNLDIWRAKVRETLAEFRCNPRQALKQAGADTLYGFLTAMALFPLVEAVQQAQEQGNWAFLMALGGIAASVGAEFVAEQIGNWRSGQDGGRYVEQEFDASEELRQQVEQLLSRLEVLPAAQEGLREADRVWLEERLRQELGPYRAQGEFTLLEQSGGVNFGVRPDLRGAHVEAAGETIDKRRGIFAGKVDVYLGPSGPRLIPPAGDRQALLDEYVRLLGERFRWLNLRGIGAEDVRIEMEQVYVRLDTTEQVKVREEERREELWRLEREEMRPLSAAEAAAREQYLVLLGGPGSGKSIFLGHLATLFGEAYLQRGEGRLRDPEELNWPHKPLLPLFVPLRRFGAWRQAQAGRLVPALLLDYLREDLEGWDLAGLERYLTHELRDGNCLVLFDGLDEVSEERRADVAEIISQFRQRYRKNRFVVTCRTLAYRDQTCLHAPFLPYELALFDWKKIEQFVHAWYRQIVVADRRIARAGKEAEAKARAADLLGAIRRAPRIRQELAPVPLLLTVIALVHARGMGLPQRRAELYQKCIEVLMEHWEAARGADSPGLSRHLGLADELQSIDHKLALLQPLAWKMHTEWGATVTRAQAEEVLVPIFCDLVGDEETARERTGRFLKFVSDRAGLLWSPDPGTYSFPHLTFQEYLVGRELAGEGFVENAFQRRGEDRWHEPILLAVGQLALSPQVHQAKALVRRLVEEDSGDRHWRNLMLAGECLLDIGEVHLKEDGRALREQVRQGLVELLRLGALPLKERVGAGNLLGQLGDPRPDPTRADTWCHVEGGPFWMGTTGERAEKLVKEFEREWFRDEVPRHQPRPELREFWIARYAVTNGEYARFLEAERRQGREHTPPRGWEGDVPPPDRLNHPVVYVSWHDAVAYCRWLTGEMQEARGKGQEAGCKVQVWREGELETWNLEPGTFAVRLPTEAEWERAARGTEEREYPWGNEFDEGKANTWEGRESWGGPGTTPIGCYPGGASPCGALDMAGNVWEWCSSLYADYPYRADDGREKPEASGSRVVRGGSFFVHRNLARCAVRNRSLPGYRDGYSGFRVVVSPISF